MALSRGDAPNSDQGLAAPMACRRGASVCSERAGQKNLVLVAEVLMGCIKPIH